MLEDDLIIDLILKGKYQRVDRRLISSLDVVLYANNALFECSDPCFAWRGIAVRPTGKLGVALASLA